ncbi:hypothetical protein B0H10DRAFT_2237941 [Mycena sp. CBHHK59/15]|nr:hypothetical protein B0H10DRAFT_2237941 [Mycena sp. CBHHK59/15]
MARLKVYYRVYAPDGAIPSKTAPDPGNPFIGRIKATSVPPPHNVLSLKRTLGELEASRTPPAEKASMLGLDLGATPETALAFVFGEGLSEKENAGLPSIDETARTYTPQDGEPLKVLQVQRPARTAFWNSDLTWLAASVGEIVHTDGICRIENHRDLDREVVGYMAADSDGRTGLIVAEKTKFLDE